MAQRLHKHTRIIAVLSGKGGVGKSTAAVNIAVGLRNKGYSTGLLDADIHGPSVPALLGLDTMKLHTMQEKIQPASYGLLKVMSLGFMLHSSDDAVIWRGPMKMQAVKQMVEEVEWGNLDFLVIDLPPGTGDEPLSICQLLPDLAGSIIVTTPQLISSIDVRRAVTFCRKLNIPMLGIIENMNHVICPECGEAFSLFPSGGAETISSDMQVPFLGSLPFYPAIAQYADTGIPFIETDHPSAAEFKNIIQSIEEKLV